MLRLKNLWLPLLFIILFPFFGSGWAEENPSPVLLFAAKVQPNRAATATTVKTTLPVKKTPDLIITSLSWSYALKAGYIVGQNSILNFTVKNQGTAPSGNFTIKLTCPDCPPSMTGTRNLTSLAPGAGLGQNWPAATATPEKWAAGTYTLEAVVDPDKVVDDMDRINNAKTLNFTVQDSSVSVKNLKIVQKPLTPNNPFKVVISSLGGIPANIYEGDSFQPSNIFVMLKNSGTQPSGSFWVTVSCDPTYKNNSPSNCLNGFENLHKEVPGIDPGQPYKVTFPAGGSGIWNWGQFHIKASIDGTNITLTKDIYVNDRAVIDSIGGIPDPFYEGDSFDPASIFVIFRNATIGAPSAPFWARISCEPIPGSGTNGTTPQCVNGFQNLHDLVPEIYPGQTYKLTFAPTGAKPWPFGRYRVTAQVIATTISTSKEIYVKSHNPVPEMSGVTVTWENLQTTYQGPCPQFNAIFLTAKITVNGKGTLKWKIITNKGDYMAGTKSHVFKGPGQITDGVIAAAESTESGWYAIQVLEPFAWQSTKVNYTIKCVAP
jgi:hypothetical protein